MVQRRQRERSLFEVLLPDGHKWWPDWLRKIDARLEDEAVIEVVAHALEARWPQSRRRGRVGTPAEVVRMMLILKHLFDWSYDDLEREVRANVVYRMFTRIDAGEVPDAEDDPEDRARARPRGHRPTASTSGRGREACGGDARPPISRRHHGRRNECALSDRRQSHVAGRPDPFAQDHLDRQDLPRDLVMKRVEEPPQGRLRWQVQHLENPGQHRNPAPRTAIDAAAQSRCRGPARLSARTDRGSSPASVD